jgi:hypothetical protein
MATQITPEMLDEVESHLEYEVALLRTMTSALSNGLFPPGAVQFALVESFVIHARALLHFFYPGRVSNGDVLAEHYLPDWSEMRGDLPEALKQVRSGAKTEIPHLSQGRLLVSEEGRDWQFPAIYNALEQLYERFLLLRSLTAPLTAETTERDYPLQEPMTRTDRGVAGEDWIERENSAELVRCGNCNRQVRLMSDATSFGTIAMRPPSDVSHERVHWTVVSQGEPTYSVQCTCGHYTVASYFPRRPGK